MSRFVALLLTASVLLAPRALADEGGLEEAMALRNASGKDWNEERYASAAEKLARAEAIYRRVPGDHTAHLAVTLRALVWNLVRDERGDEARSAFARLMDLDLDAPGVRGAISSAYGALYEAATRTEGVAGARGVLEPAREMALEQGHRELAAQVLHDLGSFARDRGDPEGSARLFEEAIAERRRIHDTLGETWSLTNLANLKLEVGETSEALPPLLDAWKAVHERRVVIPQSAVAVNLRTALAKLEESKSPTAAQEEWLWEIATTAAETDTPKVVPVDYLLLRAARISRERDPERGGAKAASRLMKSWPLAGPVEVSAHLAIEAAMMTIEGAQARDAVKWLKDLELGSGPCRPQLEARRHLALALAAAAGMKKRDFEREADAAVAAWRDLGDREGHENALRRLSEKAAALALESATARRQAYEALRQQGSPGGHGGSATGGGDRSGYGALAVNAPLFEIHMHDGRMRVHDLVADRESLVEVGWQPRAVGLNGLSLVVFGGWVKIESLSYGGAAVASGQSGRTTLEDLGEIRPVPGTGRMVVRKNGSVSYDE